jgi:8-oxo-dGTP pyrophosphatase MutT (NUDIX family)
MDKVPEDCFHLGVKVLLCNEKNRILLLEKQHRIKGTYWDLPGGRMQKGETILETLRREVEEETGLQNLKGIQPFDMILTNLRIPTIQGEVGLILSVYRGNIDSSFIPLLSSEHIDFDWFSFSDSALLLKDQYPATFVDKIAQLSSTCFV